MPYPSEHRGRVRSRIVDCARRLFNRNGFDRVSIDSIMEEAGLTRGGFYSYFESKSDLYAEVMSCFFTDPNWKSQWEGVEVDLSSNGVGPQIIRAYLSRQHFDDIENSCPMVALPNDVARSDEKVRGAFEGAFKAMVAVLGREVKSDTQTEEEVAMAIASLCIGGMVVARSLKDKLLGDRLREAATQAALALGGWQLGGEPSPRGRGETRTSSSGRTD